ncbi:MAG: hypothetical protein GEU28_14660, partial [Dehalococcoidia bacterium]|nr:hypothetical protein [Dehalococcoidia bacterium]
MSDLSGFETIAITREDELLILTLSREEHLNAVNERMHRELSEVFAAADADPDSKVIVLTGAGRAFCAGGDVRSMIDGMAGRLIRSGAQVRGEASRIVTAMLDTEKPIVSMVNGHAVGLGATIALLCDVIVAADHAKIGDPHVNVSLVAGDGGAVIWPLLIGVARAKEYLMTGKLISGADAATIGLVNHAVPAGDLRGFTLDLARSLAALDPADFASGFIAESPAKLRRIEAHYRARLG